MKREDYPSLYVFSSDRSDGSQSCFVWLSRIQYGALFAAALAALGSVVHEAFLLCYIFLICASIIITAFEFFNEAEKKWYGFRALAESTKTATWRYMMKASPFSDVDVEEGQEFSKLLDNIIISNNQVIKSNIDMKKLSLKVTDKMTQVRSSTLKDRRDFYLKNRIDEQYQWYVRKADSNEKNYVLYLSIGTVLQCIVVTFAAIHYICSSCNLFFLSQPALVLVAGLIGWMKLRKYKELASAYSLTANEISIIRAEYKELKDESAFAEFVDKVERAFSREHTQWAALRKG